MSMRATREYFLFKFSFVLEIFDVCVNESAMRNFIFLSSLSCGTFSTSVSMRGPREFSQVQLIQLNESANMGWLRLVGSLKL